MNGALRALTTGGQPTPLGWLSFRPHRKEHVLKLPLSALTLDAVNAEALRAHLKHGDKSLLNPKMPAVEKLAALVEEVGEVGRALSDDHGHDRDHLVTELVQVASVALTWVESLEGQRQS
ncbi:MAG TPA: hypothetical protein VFC19_44990 [Candidatus Limnocylindrales bacterium]|nr:hypothetical protein [Candidatus Limnocylindrales bacterium]